MGREVVWGKSWRKGKRILRNTSVGYEFVPFNVLSEIEIEIPF